jgi:hypothetical protein
VFGRREITGVRSEISNLFFLQTRNHRSQVSGAYVKKEYIRRPCNTDVTYQITYYIVCVDSNQGRQLI